MRSSSKFVTVLLLGILVGVIVGYSGALLTTGLSKPTATPLVEGGQKLERLVVGFIPTEKVQELTPRAERLGRFIESELGVPTEVFVPTIYEPLIEGLKFGKVHVAFMDTGPAWIAYRRAGAEVIAAEVNAGQTYYWAAIFVRRDSDIKSLEDLRGKRIAFTSITGSSGFILPVGRMVEAGILRVKGDGFAGIENGLKETFTRYIFAGGYGPALDLLYRGEVDAAAGSEVYYETAAKPELKENVKILTRLGKVPSHVVVVSKDLPETVKLKLTIALQRLNEPNKRDILVKLYGVDALVPTTTTAHMGEFGKAIDQLIGLEELIIKK